MATARESSQGVDSGQVCIADALNPKLTGEDYGVDIQGLAEVADNWAVIDHRGLVTVVKLDGSRDWRVYAEFTGSNNRPSAIVALPVGSHAHNGLETIGTIPAAVALVISDPCYILTDEDYRGVLLVANNCLLPSGDLTNGEIDDTTWLESHGMANSSTLYGDGEYPIEVTREGGAIVGIRVFFDDDPEDETCGTCGLDLANCMCDDEADDDNAECGECGYPEFNCHCYVDDGEDEDGEGYYNLPGASDVD